MAKPSWPWGAGGELNSNRKLKESYKENPFQYAERQRAWRH